MTMPRAKIKKLAKDPVAEENALYGLNEAWDIAQEHIQAWERVGMKAQADAVRHVQAEILDRMFKV